MNFLETLKKASDGAVKILDNNKEKILLGTGIALGVGTVVVACKATLKAQDILEEHKELSEMIKEAEEVSPDVYKGSEDNKKDIVKLYANTGVKLAKEFAPAAILGTTSIFCVIAQHKLMENKVVKLEGTVASLTAAYAAIDTAFKNYRKRVVEKYGEEEDRDLRYGIKKETVEVTETDSKGKEKKKKVKVSTIEGVDHSDYAKFFDCTSDQFIFSDPYNHKPDWDANIRFLNCTQAYAQQKLELQGYLFLNDVYEMLGIPKTKAGQVVGWIFDPEDDRIDSRIDFGIFEPRNHRTINGYEEECILLDFNVDGVIIDKVNKIAEY